MQCSLQKEGDEACDESSVPIPRVVPDILLNLYPYELKTFRVTHKSSEHAFQYAKAVRSWDIPRANAIQSASVPKRAKSHLDAKRIGKVTSGSKRLEYSYLDLMTELICDLYLYPRNGNDSIPNMLTTVTTDVNTAIYVQAVMK